VARSLLPLQFLVWVLCVAFHAAHVVCSNGRDLVSTVSGMSSGRRLPVVGAALHAVRSQRTVILNRAGGEAEMGVFLQYAPTSVAIVPIFSPTSAARVVIGVLLVRAACPSLR
jgi:hypothetical protein